MPQKKHDSKTKPGRGNPEQVTIWRWPLPQDVRNVLPHFRTEVTSLLSQSPDNPALLLQRYVAFPVSEKKEDVSQPAEKFAEKLFQKSLGKWGWEESKNKLWFAIVDRLKELYQNNGMIAGLLHDTRSLQEELLQAFKKQGFEVRTFCVEVVWRVIVGLGLPSPLEVGITLHHLYGFPYLPGSAIKGVTRNYKLHKIADELGILSLSAEHVDLWESLEQLLISPVPDAADDEERKEKLSNEIERRYNNLQKTLTKVTNNSLLLDKNKLREYIRDFSRAFGSTEAKGMVIFFDAYPENLMLGKKPILELDVMTPHYGEYYTGGSPPADWLSPKPVVFLAVRQGTVFRIHLACRDKALANKVQEWVEAALQKLGLGAKTRAGYGELRRTETVGPKKLEEVTPEKTSILTTPALAINKWSLRDMGSLPQLITQLVGLSDPVERRSLAIKLQEKLKEAGRWGGKYREKPWHKQLEELLKG